MTMKKTTMRTAVEPAVEVVVAKAATTVAALAKVAATTPTPVRTVVNPLMTDMAAADLTGEVTMLDTKAATAAKR